jgi:hypothetical protein
MVTTSKVGLARIDLLTRTLTLYWTFVLEFFHRLRHDWARELVVLVAGSVLFATFLYIFNDFLDVEITSLSVKMRDRIAEVIAAIVWVIAAIVAGNVIRRERFGEQSLTKTARLLGEVEGTITAYMLMRAATVIAVVHGVAWVLVAKVLVRPEARTAAAIETAMILLAVYLGTVGTVPKCLAQWRWTQILFRSRIARLTLLVAATLLLFLPLSAARDAPPFISFVISLAVGYVVSLTLVFQLADDLPNAWTERGLGVTHDQFVTAYEQLGRRLGLVYGAIGAALYLLGKLAGPGITMLGLNEAAKVLVVTALPAIMTPWLLFQIEGRRAGVGAILVLIATLFVGTAVYANWLSLLLPVLLRYYALNAQAGRFYRA